jgi:phosphatidate phosphatase APP1
MKKGYCLAILILLVISSMALTASASSTNRWPASGDITAFGSEQGQYANQMAQTSNQVTLTFYVLDGGPNGELLPGVDVKVYDASGNSFEGVTDSRGPLIISGQPGPWKFTLAKEGYKTSNMEYAITQSDKAFTYLQKRAQSAPSQVTEEAAAYPQRTVQSTEPAQLQKPVALTVNIHEGYLNGAALSGVEVTGQDAAGNSFEGTTDSNGAAVITGQPGAWQFTFTKEGYETLNLNYNVTETEEAAAYLQRIAQSAAAPAQLQEPVDFTVYVHQDTINGTALSGVDITGKDGAGNGFEGTTDSNGASVISGQPGTWQFTFTKEGYETLNLNYNVTETDYGDVYLQSADQLSQSEVPVVSEAAPFQAISTPS